MEPVELLLNMAAAMTERTTLIYVRVAAAAGGGVSEVKWGGRMCRLLLSACLLLCLPACRLCQHRSLFIVRSLAVLTLMPAADPIPSVAPPLPHSLSLYLCCFLSLSVLAWLGLALLGYSRCCRGRQLKLWILCVISFY